MSSHDPSLPSDGPVDPSQPGQGAEGELASGPRRRGESGEEEASFEGRRRLRRVIRALRSLDPIGAPAALEGLVVASMNVGHRQERAVRSLRLLTGVTAPSGLDAAVAAHVLRHDPRSAVIEEAPDELEAMVARRLADPEGTLAEGFAQRLEAVGAPNALDQRIDAKFGQAADLGKSHAPRFARGTKAAAGALALAACVLFAFTTTGLFSDGSNSAPESTDSTVAVTESDGLELTSSGLLFEVVRVAPDSLEPTDREVLSVLGLSMDGGNS